MRDIYRESKFVQRKLTYGTNKPLEKIAKYRSQAFKPQCIVMSLPSIYNSRQRTQFVPRASLVDRTRHKHDVTGLGRLI